MVVGLDLSITGTGVATNVGTFTIKPTTEGDHRLTEIVQKLAGPCRYADLVAVEGPVLRSSAALALGMLHGAVRAHLLGHAIAYVVVPPKTLKKFGTGNGNADKTAMALAAFKRAGVEFPDSDQCDAWWLWQAGMFLVGQPALDLPAAQRAALSAVRPPVHDAEAVR